MKKKWTVIALLLAVMLVLAGCCDHEWAAADCENPQTCIKCEKTEGDPNGHDWKDADCLDPQTCVECGATEGSPLGHTWLDATCTEGPVCSVCGETEGDPLGHTWLDATTEAPMTCSACGETEGERIITDERFHTADCQALFGTWSGQVTLDGLEFLATEMEFEGVNLEGQDMSFLLMADIRFENDGTCTISIAFDEEDFMRVMRTLTLEMMYVTLEAEGLSRDEADAYFQTALGMDLNAYVDLALQQMDMDQFSYESQGVYYVEDGLIYTGGSWDGEMVNEMTLNGDKLTAVLDGLMGATDLQLELTRVEE